MKRLLLGTLALAGCHHVFGAEHGTSTTDGGTSDAAATCHQVQPLSPDDDEDLDTIPNGRDNCAARSNLDQHDENANGIGDVCDLCPAASEVQDAECDGIGDVCDPDDTRADVRVFYGCADLVGFDTYTELGAVIVANDDRVHINAATDEGYALLHVAGGARIDGRYETRFSIDESIDTNFKLTFEVAGNTADGAGAYAIDLVGGARLEVRRKTTNHPDLVLGGTSLSPTSPGVYILVVDVVYPRLTATLSGVQSAVLEVALDVAIAPPIRFGISAYEVSTSIEYLACTGAKL